jgi:hypothetical protein
MCRQTPGYANRIRVAYRTMISAASTVTGHDSSG